MKKVLITGGTGFIGFHLAKYHSEYGDEVYIVDNLSKDKKKIDEDLETLLGKDNIFFFEYDLTEKISLNQIPKEIDYVYHLAAINGTDLFYKIPYELCRNNTLLTINFLDFLKGFKVEKLIYASTSEVYAGGEEFNLVRIPTAEDVPVVFPQPTDNRFSYSTSKFLGEFLSLRFGELFSIPTSIIRFHNIYGPRMGYRHVIPNFIEKATNNSKNFIINGGKNTRSFCFIDDAINALIKVAKSQNTNFEILHVGNENEEIQMTELAKQVCKIMGKEFTFSDVGAPNMSANRRCPDISKITKLTGFNPGTTLTSGLITTIDWYLSDFSREN